MPSSASPLKRPSRLQIWFRALRVPVLITTLIPLLLGGGLALIDRGFDGWTFLLTMIAVLLLHAGANLFNDYYDFRKGADLTDSSKLFGALQMGWLTTRQVLIVAWLCYLLSAILGFFIVRQGGVFLLVLGLVLLALGYFYSASRVALAYTGLGEFAVFLAMGPLLVLFTYYAMVKIVYSHVILTGIPFALVTVAVLHINNLRDLDHDKKIGKTTLATLLGHHGAKWLYMSLLVLAYLLPIVLFLSDVTPSSCLLPMLTLPLAVKIGHDLVKTDDPMELNLELGLSMLLQLLYGILNVFGLFLYYFRQL